MKVLRGKKALVTGAAMGMGREIARLLLLEGMDVAVVDVREVELEATAGELSALGRVAAFTCDVSDRASVYGLAETVAAEFGEIDLLVNNAGIVKANLFTEKPDELIERTVGVNLLATFWTMKAFLPGMISRRAGHIVNMASAGGILGVPYITDYCATKFAVVGLTESLRQELKLQGLGGIKMSYVCPNTVGTGMFEGNRPVRGTRMLEPGYVAVKIVKAVRKDREKIYIPSAVHLAALLRDVLPTRLMDFISRMTGVSTSSKTMTGRDLPA